MYFISRVKPDPRININLTAMLAESPADVHEQKRRINGRFLYSIFPRIFHYVVYWAGPSPHWRILTRLLVVGSWIGVLWAIIGEAILPKTGSTSTDYIDCIKAVNVTEYGNDTSSSVCDELEVDGVVTFERMFNNFSIGYSFVNCCVNKINFVVQSDIIDWNQTIDVLDNATEHPVKDPHESLVTKEGQVFALMVLLIASAFGGFVARVIRLPSLFGMLVVGIMLRNIDAIAVVEDIDDDVASIIRSIALVLILTRGGLFLDAGVVRKLKYGIAKLAFLPCLCEGIIEGLVGHFILGIPWVWSFMLGFVLSANSPMILIPALLNLQDHGFGTNKGIPSLLIASSTLDGVLTITLFSVLLGIFFNAGEVNVFTLFRGPLEIVIGLAYGIGFGLICWKVPHRSDTNKGSRTRNRVAIITGLTLFGYLSATRRTEMDGIGLVAAGPLAVTVLSFVATIGWKKAGRTFVNRTLVILWKFFQPMSIAFIGAGVDFSAITGDDFVRGLAVLACGVAARLLGVYFALKGDNLNTKETIFVMIAWLPKATVQSSIVVAALNQATRSGTDEERDFAETVLNIVLFDIMIFGPIGALTIGLLGPHLLTQEGHHHVHIEHNIEGEVDITGNIESESESESSDDEEYETCDDPGYESLNRHVVALQPSVEAPEFHCCVDCARLQDHLRIECFRQMIDHEYVVNKLIHTSSICHHGTGHSSESQSYMSVQEDTPEISVNVIPDSEASATELIEKKHHRFPFLHHLHLPGKHHHRHHRGHSHDGTSLSSCNSNLPPPSTSIHVEVAVSVTHEPNGINHSSSNGTHQIEPDNKIVQVRRTTEI